MRSHNPENMFRLVKDYFDEIDSKYRLENRFFIRVSKGKFMPSELDHMKNFFAKAISEKYFSIDEVFTDAGSGDGRVGLCASLVFGIKTLLVEYEPEFYHKSIMHIDKFKRLLANQNIPIKVIQGDFSDIQTYRDNGLEFKEIKTFFNYWSNHLDIADTINQHSPKGTKLIIHNYTKNHEKSVVLNYLTTIESEFQRLPINLTSENNSDNITYFHIFEK